LGGSPFDDTCTGKRRGSVGPCALGGAARRTGWSGATAPFLHSCTRRNTTLNTQHSTLNTQTPRSSPGRPLRDAPLRTAPRRAGRSDVRAQILAVAARERGPELCNFSVLRLQLRPQARNLHARRPAPSGAARLLRPRRGTSCGARGEGQAPGCELRWAHLAVVARVEDVLLQQRCTKRRDRVGSVVPAPPTRVTPGRRNVVAKLQHREGLARSISKVLTPTRVRSVRATPFKNILKGPGPSAPRAVRLDSFLALEAQQGSRGGKHNRPRPSSGPCAEQVRVPANRRR
jgi:hypothetical protein